MMHFVTKAMPIDCIDSKWHKLDLKGNQSRKIQIMPLIIYPLGGIYTYILTQTHTRVQTHIQTLTHANVQVHKSGQFQEARQMSGLVA